MKVLTAAAVIEPKDAKLCAKILAGDSLTDREAVYKGRLINLLRLTGCDRIRNHRVGRRCGRCGGKPVSHHAKE
jgi:hypothetical protein